MAKELIPIPYPKGDGHLQVKVNALRQPHKRVILQSQAREELGALLPSVLRPSGGAFRGELCPPSRPSP
jgi:hypothetical protein